MSNQNIDNEACFCGHLGRDHSTGVKQVCLNTECYCVHFRIQESFTSYTHKKAMLEYIEQMYPSWLRAYNGTGDRDTRSAEEFKEYLIGTINGPQRRFDPEPEDV